MSWTQTLESVPKPGEEHVQAADWDILDERLKDPCPQASQEAAKMVSMVLMGDAATMWPLYL